MLQDPPLGDPRLDLARELLASVVDLPVGDDPTLAASPRARCEALAGLAIIAPSDALDAALAALRAGAAPLGAQGVELAAGAEARARLRLARLTGATPAEAFAAAAAPLTTLLAAPEASEPGPHRDAAWSRLALVVPHGADPAALPPHAAMALAVAGPSDGAASLFARVAAAPDADLAAEALWRAGALRRSAETPLPGAWAEAVTRFPDARWTRHALTEIARAFAADTRALAAIEPGAEPPVVAEARRRYAPVEPVLLAALRHAAASPAAGSTPAAWRYLAAEAGAALAEPFTLSAFEAVLRDLDAVPSDAPQASRAAPLAGRAARRALRAVSDAPPTQGVAAAASLAAIVAEHRLLKNDGALALAAATALGRRQIAAGRAAEAARTLRAAIRSDATAGAADARLLLAVALRADARPDDALAALREITDAFDAPPVVGARPEVYWLAWAEALEILAQRPDQHGAVRVRIGQLELIDPRLGGGAAAGRIAQVKSAVR